jgi:nucleoside-diphosphate kinase
MQEKTLLMIKPDAVSRGLENDIFKRVEQSGLKLVKKQSLLLNESQAADLYSPHLGKSFYDGLVKFITSGPVICVLVEGEDAISRLRKLMGATDPREALPGTIRGDLKEENIFNRDGTIKNLVHGSDSKDSAKREIGIFFK